MSSSLCAGGSSELTARFFMFQCSWHASPGKSFTETSVHSIVFLGNTFTETIVSMACFAWHGFWFLAFFPAKHLQKR